MRNQQSRFTLRIISVNSIFNLIQYYQRGCSPGGLERRSPLVKFIGAFGVATPFDFKILQMFL